MEGNGFKMVCVGWFCLQMEYEIGRFRFFRLRFLMLLSMKHVGAFSLLCLWNAHIGVDLDDGLGVRSRNSTDRSRWL